MGAGLTSLHTPQLIAARMQAREFLHWLEESPRTYAETMAAWRSSCPRLTIWEDALADGLVEIVSHPGRGFSQATVTLTPRGRAFLARSREDPPRP